MGKKFQILSFLFSLVFLQINRNANAQSYGVNDTIKVYAFVVDGDTIPGGRMYDVFVQTRIQEKWRNYWAEWTRLRNAVYITYPYAKAAGKVMNEVNQQLAGVADKQERKKIIKLREKELKKEFTDKLDKLSVYQGKVLMKLIYRETGNNCYHIIQEYKGGFTAGFYQTIMILVGSNLKQNYDPALKDRDLESIVLEVARMYGHI